MKVLIDLDAALAGGKISQEEHVRLKSLAGGQTSDLALGIVIGFGIIAVAVGFLALSQSVYTTPLVGLALAGGGLAIEIKRLERWRLLGQILLVVGTVILAGGIVLFDFGSQRSIVYATLILAGAAIFVENGLLAVLAVIALSSALGASSSYEHARYTLVIESPAETIAVFTGLAVALVFAATRLPRRYERIALIAARTGALLVNFGFLVGSLWGDRLRDIAVSRNAFSLGWALVLIAVGVWAWRENRRWPLITATVFAAIHFYTQWFERIGIEPAAILFAGLSTIAIGYGLKQALTTMPPAGPELPA